MINTNDNTHDEKQSLSSSITGPDDSDSVSHDKSESNKEPEQTIASTTPNTDLLTNPSTDPSLQASEEAPPETPVPLNREIITHINSINLLPDDDKETLRIAIQEFISFLSPNLEQIDFKTLINYISQLNPHAQGAFLLTPFPNLMKTFFTSKENILEFLGLFEPVPAVIFLFNLNIFKLSKIDTRIQDLITLKNIASVIPLTYESALLQHMSNTKSPGLVNLMYLLYFLPDDSMPVSKDPEVQEDHDFVVLQDKETKLMFLHNNNIWKHITTPLELEIITRVIPEQDRLQALQTIFLQCPEKLKLNFQNFEVLTRLAELIPVDKRNELFNIVVKKLDDTVSSQLVEISETLDSIGTTAALLATVVAARTKPLVLQALPIASLAMDYAWEHRSDIAKAVGELLLSIQYPYLCLARGAATGCYSFWRSMPCSTLETPAHAAVSSIVRSTVRSTANSAAAVVAATAVKYAAGSATTAITTSTQQQIRQITKPGQK